MQKYIILVFLFPVNFLFGQYFTAPMSNFETTQSLGFKNGAKTVTEYAKNESGYENKKVYYFNENGVLTSEESYEDNDPEFNYYESDKEGRHVSEKTTYQFKGNRLIAVEISEIVEEGMSEDANGMLQTNGLYMDTKKLPYVYDKKGRLKSYTVWNRWEDELTFHLSYLNQNVIQYYFLSNEKDSILIHETKTELDGVSKKVTEIEYEKEEKDRIEEYFYQNDKQVQFISLVRNADGTMTQQIQNYDTHDNLIELKQLTKEKEDTIFRLIAKEGYKYEYAEDGTLLKIYHTEDFENYDLVNETNIEYKDTQKIVSVRHYNSANLLESETIKTYDLEGELTSETDKCIYGEDGKLYKQPRVCEQNTYRRIYTFY